MNSLAKIMIGRRDHGIWQLKIGMEDRLMEQLNVMTQSSVSIFPLLHATSIACLIARSTRLGVV
mgnify:CR=1 FL=1